MDTSSPRPDQDIIRVKTQIVGDEFELIVPRGLAEILDLKGNRTVQSQHIVPTQTPPARSLQEQAASVGILAIEQAISPDICLQIIEHARTQKRFRSGLISYDQTEEKHKESFIDDKVRDTYNISTDAINDSMLKGIFFELAEKYIEPFFKHRLDWWEQPQLLYYDKGGKYEPHVDADYWVKNPDGTEGWKRISDRDISILLYLNEDFEGGELNFPDYNFLIKPKPGLLVAFPSGKEYRHGASPTLSGERYVLVSWASAEGVAKIQPQPPKYAVIWMKEMRASA